MWLDFLYLLIRRGSAKCLHITICSDTSINQSTTGQEKSTTVHHTTCKKKTIHHAVEYAIEGSENQKVNQLMKLTKNNYDRRQKTTTTGQQALPLNAKCSY